MRDEKVFRLGTVRIDGDLIEFEREGPLTFSAGRRDAISVGIHYDYREASDEEEEALIRLTAHLVGQPPQTEERAIHDHPVMDDSRRGFLSIPIRVAAAGPVRGRFTVEAKYGSGPWRKPKEVETEARAEGEFAIDVQ